MKKNIQIGDKVYLTDDIIIQDDLVKIIKIKKGCEFKITSISPNIAGEDYINCSIVDEFVEINCLVPLGSLEKEND